MADGKSGAQVGLDWNPIGKARPGFESEFEELFLQIGQLRRGDPAEETVQKRFWEISISPYETLAAPQVGFDPKADEWARQQFPSRSDKSLTLEKFLAGMREYYVLDLVPVNDGLPVYTNAYIASYCDKFSFRAQFLKDLEGMLGSELLDEAFVHHNAQELADYGQRLRDCATEFAKQNGVREILDQRESPGLQNGPKSQAHIVSSAARWCLFWSERGHGMEADW
jgi:hypothetical protein